MIKILVVEDQAEKRQRILSHLTSLEGITLDNIRHSDNVIDAKRHIKQTKFDLLVLDINIPRRADQIPTRAAGLDIITFIKENSQAIAPSYIFGMTAYEEEFSDASLEFSSALWKLVRFSHEDTSWQGALTAAAKFLLSKDSPPFHNDGTTYHVDAGIIVALEEELDPFRTLLDNWTELHVPHDPSRYFQGQLSINEKTIHVVAVACPRMGLPTAAVITTKLLLAFRPRYLLTTGICAGVRSKTNIGDILISDPSFDWGSGKWAKAEDGGLEFKPAAYPWRLGENLRRVVTVLGDDLTLLNDLGRSFDGQRPANPPTVKIDAMASGGSVLQADDLMKDIQAQHKNLIGIDMESYGVLTAVEYCGQPKPEAIAIKSVCDFGDGEKNDHYHNYAAQISAGFACNLLKKLDFDS